MRREGIVASEWGGHEDTRAAVDPEVDLEVEALTKSFGPVRAVAGVSFTARRSRIVSLLGPSGCGKTTVLNIIAGFVQPDAGSVRIGGESVGGVPANRRQVAMVFQSYALFPHMTVGNNVAFGLSIRGRRPTEIEGRVTETLRVVRLEGLEDRYPRQLSGGQQQRVALARALIVRPRVLLLDEPLSNLDARLRDEMRAELKEILRKSGATTVFVTHDQSEALALSDQVIVMHAGRVEQWGTPREVYEAPGTPFVAQFVGLSNLLTGTVIDGEPAGSHWLRTAQGLRVPIAPGAGASAGETRTMLIRPEDISVASEPVATENLHQGVVRELQYQGASVICRVRVGEREFVATATVQALGDLREGRNAWVGWNTDRAFLIPG